MIQLLYRLVWESSGVRFGSSLLRTRDKCRKRCTPSDHYDENDTEGPYIVCARPVPSIERATKLSLMHSSENSARRGAYMDKKTHKYSTLRWSRSRAASTDQRMSGNGEIYIDIAYIHCGSMSPVRIPTTRIHFPLSASVELVIMSHSPGFTSAPCPYIDLYPFDVYTTYTEGYEERNVEHNDERLTLYPYHLEFKTGPRLVCERLVLQKSAGRWCMRFLRRHRRWYRQPEALHPLRLCRDDGSSG